MIVMVKFNNVKKQYKDFCLDCSIEIPKGQITGIIGRNGAGKTTAFKAMLGLIKIDGGTIELFGKDVQKLTAQDRQRIGVVLADSGFCGYLTIKDYAQKKNLYRNVSAWSCQSIRKSKTFQRE